MRKIINKINDFLRKFPRFRSFIIKIIYYFECFIFRFKNFLAGKKNGFLSEAIRITPLKRHCFFGYYDKSPYSYDDKKILYHEIKGMRAPIIGQKADIYIQDIETSKRTKLGETLAWNLQQGAMLRFYSKDIVSWNDYLDKKYCCVFLNLNTNTKTVISAPLYDISSDGNFGLSLEFERLNIDAEGYGYIQERKSIVDFQSPAYISLVDIKNNIEKIIIDSNSLNKSFPIKHKGVSFFYFNHLCFNQSGKRFLFIERYEFEHKRYSRLFSADLDGKNIHLLAHEQMVSHFTWLNDNYILLFCKHDGVDAYYLINDAENPMYSRIENDQMMKDGHPTFVETENNKSFISDTYPFKDRYRELFIYTFSENKREVLARLSSPIKYDGPIRCDLHPRLNRSRNCICIDSIHEGFRGVYQIKMRCN